MFPKDPVLLVGYVNLKLRDMYQSPEAMCDDMDISLDEINSILKSAGYAYDANTNQYR